MRPTIARVGPPMFAGVAHRSASGASMSVSKDPEGEFTSVGVVGDGIDGSGPEVRVPHEGQRTPNTMSNHQQVAPIARPGLPGARLRQDPIPSALGT